MAFLRTIDNLELESSLTLKQTTGNYIITWANPAAARALNVIDPGGADTFLFEDAIQIITNKSINASQINSGTLAIIVGIPEGGTGQTTAQAAINALVGFTTKGDILVYTGSNAVRRGVGTNNQVPVADSADSTGVSYQFAGLVGSQTISGTATLTNTSPQKILTDAAAGSFIITLPLASTASGIQFCFKKINANPALKPTIQAAGADTIDGATSFVLTLQWDSITIFSNGTNWFII